MDDKIPVENELLTTAKISDSLVILENIKLLEDLATILNNGSMIVEKLLVKNNNIKSRLLFWSDIGTVMSDTFIEHCKYLIDIMNKLEVGVVINDSETSRALSSCNAIYLDLLEFGDKIVNAPKYTESSIVDGELASALSKIEHLPLANIIKLNSLIYLNINSLQYIVYKYSHLVSTVNIGLSKIESMAIMGKATSCYSISMLESELSEIMFDNVISPIIQLVDGKYINNSGSTGRPVTPTSTVEELVNEINENIAKAKEIEKTLNIVTLHSLLKLEQSELINVEGDIVDITWFKENIIRTKLALNCMSDLITKCTDNINDSITKITKSIPEPEIVTELE